MNFLVPSIVINNIFKYAFYTKNIEKSILVKARGMEFLGFQD